MSVSDSNSYWIRDYEAADDGLTGLEIRRLTTKESRKGSARAIIDRNRLNVLFPPADVAALNAILGTQFSGFVKRPNPRYASDTRHLYAIIAMEAFSWNEAISPTPAVLRIKKVMRNVVQDLLNEFLEAVSDPLCGCCGSKRDLTADHNPPFDYIATEFIARRGVPVTKDADNGVGDVFADPNVEAAWIAFHQGLTTLSVLCRSCNSSKGMHGECRLDHGNHK